MDILWIALGICGIVGFVFVVLARHWQRLLAHQTWSIRRLTDRLHSLEEVANPAFRRRLDESAPSPLEQVYTFGLRLDEDFWRNTLPATREERAYIREHGNFLGAVKVERWRSHTVVTVSEVLPHSKSAGWQTRTFDIFPDVQTDSENAVTLWEMSLAEEKAGDASGRVPTLELVWRDNRLDLVARAGGYLAANYNDITLTPDERLLLSIPMDPELLQPYRQIDETPPVESEESITQMAESGAQQSAPWVAYYSHEDRQLGIEWHLYLRDLSKQSEWKRWRIVESLPMTKVG
jgi:hypothetical protein